MVEKVDKPKKYELYDANELEDFESKSIKDKYTTVLNMPMKLQNKLLGDAANPEDYHTTSSHKCKLRKCIESDEGKWYCSRALNGKPCLSKMKSMEDSKGGHVQGWKCPRGDYCDEETNFVICLKCLRVDYLVE